MNEQAPVHDVESTRWKAEVNDVQIPNILPLESETETGISPEDLRTREELVVQLRRLTHETFSNLQYLQPQIGCFNRCAFCSQSAGRDIWQVTKRGLANLFSALKTVASEKSGVNKSSDQDQKSETPGNIEQLKPLIGYGRPDHKPGTVFPYLDNDIASYPHLYDYVRYLYQDLGAKVRISTVGFSRHNEDLQRMHERVVKDFPDAFSGVRLSFTPYTYGLTEAAEEGGLANKEEFMKDMMNMLRTYQPLADRLGISKETFCVELRFKPLVETQEKPLDEIYIGDYHVVRFGGKMILFREMLPDIPTRVTDIKDNAPVFSNEGTQGFMFMGDAKINDDNWDELAKRVIEGGTFPMSEDLSIVQADDKKFLAKQCRIYLFENLDGYYYAIDPSFEHDGVFKAKQFYPKTERRRRSGYIDSERYFLNSILRYKKDRNLGRREEFASATWDDADSVITSLDIFCRELQEFDLPTAEHIQKNILLMVGIYRKVLEGAGYPAKYFFDRRFTIDTGQIVNQGRAINQFDNLTDQEDMPLTPHEERGYGENSFSSRRGYVWRISPSPVDEKGITIGTGSMGKKNVPNPKHGITVSKLDWHNLSPISPDGKLLPSVFVEGVELEKIPLESSVGSYLLPGLKRIDSD